MELEAFLNQTCFTRIGPFGRDFSGNGVVFVVSFVSFVLALMIGTACLLSGSV